MTKLQELLNLTMLEADLIQFGKIEENPDKLYPTETKRDKERLRRFSFIQLCEKYYGHGKYLAKYSLEDQLRYINDLKRRIMEDYKEE